MCLPMTMFDHPEVTLCDFGIIIIKIIIMIIIMIKSTYLHLSSYERKALTLHYIFKEQE